EWICDAAGAVSWEQVDAAEALHAWPPAGAESLEADFIYDLLAEYGLQYGPAFQGLTKAWQEGEQVFAEIVLPDEQAQGAERFEIHPALLDAALHGIALTATEGSAEMKLPFSWSGVSLRAPGAKELRVRISADGDSVSLQLADGAGAPVATVSSLVSRPVDLSQLQGSATKQDRLLGLEWKEL